MTEKFESRGLQILDVSISSFPERIGGSFLVGKGSKGVLLTTHPQLHDEVEKRAPLHLRPQYVIRGVVLD
jgi:hypothetical protein